MRARKTAIAASACAFVLLGAGSALAGTGPAPAPDARKAAPQSTAPSADGNPRSLKAQAAGVCSDAYQIGTTAYIDRKGAHAASVKQFYSPSCKKNYGYVWVWQSFRDKVKDYDVSTGVYSYARDEIVGQDWWNKTNVQEFWSLPAATANECTSAVGELRAPGDPLPGHAMTSKRC
ncbi:hypothetical protein [Streptomyces flavofungini]|uniref:Secreted protein n=1 Tax=Streptomyces flavofungini TaxID=68200 RepID=A0ABS0X5W6_9ACTN|nr:hypothetical protein [Streptomyces flavofungini]MBJ3808589.1 hypothetical protein [Streptomyces flavofungini]GHC70408.1 hypothetical protein GCM10010349_46060 [Streptomyces flavofungini]